MKTLLFLPILCLALITFSCEKEDIQQPSVVFYVDQDINALTNTGVVISGTEDYTFRVRIDNFTSNLVNTDFQLQIDEQEAVVLPEAYLEAEANGVAAGVAFRSVDIKLPLDTDAIFADADEVEVLLNTTHRETGRTLTSSIVFLLE